jgi:hypothetical protein
MPSHPLTLSALFLKRLRLPRSNSETFGSKNYYLETGSTTDLPGLFESRLS